jgi:hypothetical protein
MNKKLKIFLFLLTVFLSFVISILFWKNISLNLTNYDNVIGFYSDNNISNYNNLLHFIFFTGFPILTFFILIKKIFYNNVSFINIFKNKLIDEPKENKALVLILIFSLLIITLNYLSIDLVLNSVDYFHEGLTLSSALNYYKTGLLWDGAYLSNSLFSDILSAIIPWKIFDIVSIGSYKIFHFFLRYLTEIFLIFFIYKLSFIYDLKKNTQIIFFTIIVLISLKLNRDLTEIFYPFRYRDIPIFTLLFLSIDFIKFENRKIITPFLLGFFSSFFLLWSLDRGIYYLISILILIILSAIKKKYLSISILVTGVIISFLLAHFFLGASEVQSFFYNASNVIKDFDLFAGSSYPTIFDFENKHSSRGTINLFIIILNGFLISFLFLTKKFKLTGNSKIFLLFFFIVSFLIYKSALSVPDGYHMKQSIFFNKIFFITNLLFIAIHKNYFDNIKNLKLISFTLLILIISKNLFDINYSNISSFKDRNLMIVNKNDDLFFDNKYIDLKNYLSKNYDLKCVQLFTYDAIIPYLLKKEYCTKFNFLYVLSSDSVQERMIKEMKINMPKIIIFNENYDFLILKPVEERFKKITNYIIKNYMVDRKINNWVIYKKR